MSENGASGEAEKAPVTENGGPIGVGIRLFGLGGAGMNAAARLSLQGLAGIELHAVNTDSQALSRCSLEHKHLAGEGVTRGLGAGGDPELGQRAAEAERGEMERWMAGADVVFLVTGLGGGTGGPLARVAAEAAEKAGALTLGFAVMPFSFEGTRRRRQAEDALAALRQVCSAVVPLPNDMLLQQLGEDAPVLDVLRKSDEWIVRAVGSIRDVLCRPGQINLDLGDLKRVFPKPGGKTLCGFGSGEGERPADNAFSDLLMCPLLHTPEFASRADHLLVNVSAGPDLAINELHKLADRIGEHFGRDGRFALGAAIEDGWRGRVEICVLGASDIGGGSTASDRRNSAAASSQVPASRRSTPERAKKRSSSGKQTTGPTKSSQEEFGFEETTDKRGLFDRSESNTFEGEDLDVPTYFRRGIRISL